MEHISNPTREVITRVLVRAIQNYRIGEGSDPLPLEIAERFHEQNQAPTYLCGDCGLPVLNVALHEVHLHTFDPRCLRECDECGRVTEASAYPDWINGMCEDCDPAGFAEWRAENSGTLADYRSRHEGA